TRRGRKIRKGKHAGGRSAFYFRKMRRLHAKACDTDGGYKATSAGKAVMQICIQITIRHRAFNSANNGNGSARVRNAENTVCGILFGVWQTVRQTRNIL